MAVFPVLFAPPHPQFFFTFQPVLPLPSHPPSNPFDSARHRPALRASPSVSALLGCLHCPSTPGLLRPLLPEPPARPPRWSGPGSGHGAPPSPQQSNGPGARLLVSVRHLGRWRPRPMDVEAGQGPGHQAASSPHPLKRLQLAQGAAGGAVGLPQHPGALSCSTPHSAQGWALVPVCADGGSGRCPLGWGRCQQLLPRSCLPGGHSEAPPRAVAWVTAQLRLRGGGQGGAGSPGRKRICVSGPSPGRP